MSSDEGIHILGGAVAGAIGGLVGSWVMNQLQAATHQPEPKAQSGDEGHQKDSVADRSGERRLQSGGDDATVKTAEVISRGLFDHALTPAEKKYAGPAVHYSYGALVGGIYGAVAEIWPTVTVGIWRSLWACPVRPRR